MSKYKEIKEKEQLQLQLQARFTQLDQTVLSWLTPTDESTETSSKKQDSSISTEFGNLQVVPGGAGIDLEDTKDGESSNSSLPRVTINDFLEGTNTKKRSKKDDNLSRIKKPNNTTNGTSASASLRALSNKLRNDRRNKTEQKAPPQSQQQRGKYQPQNDKNKSKFGNSEISDDNSEDSDNEIFERRAKKKFSGKRPF